MKLGLKLTNLCWLLPATIQIPVKKRGNIFRHFGDEVDLDPPNIVPGQMVLEDFLNHRNLFRLHFAAKKLLIFSWIMRKLLIMENYLNRLLNLRDRFLI